MDKALYYMKRITLMLLKIIGYHNSKDNSSHWRSRATCSGSTAVLWSNESYNDLVRRKQLYWFRKYIENLPEGSSLLDFGCGVGYVSKTLVNLNNEIFIKGVDFKEMVSEAKNRHSHPNIIYKSISEWANENKKYDVLLSSAALSAIRDDKVRIATMESFCKVAKKGATVLMIDPFHKWSYLARAKMSRYEVIAFMQKRGFVLVEQSGMLFWPFRMFLSNSTLSRDKMIKWFSIGESVLSVLGKTIWSDYKILVFQKK